MQRIHECLPPEPPPSQGSSSAAEDGSTTAGNDGAASAPVAAAAAAEAGDDDDSDGPKPPSNLCCPITLHLFRDPVTASDGETYERTAIEEHIRVKRVMLAAAQEELNVTNGESNEAQRALMKNGITSPMGHGTLESLVLVPARMARRMADQWREENGVS